MVYQPGQGSGAIRFGPGRIYFGAEGPPEPTDLTTALNVGWLPAGYTDNGHTFTFTPAFENIEVAEVMLALFKVETGQEMGLEFALAELTAKNFQRAFNGATITTTGTGATAIDKVEPLAFGVTKPRVAILWEADDKSERWVWRRALQTGAVAVARQRGAAKATIPVNYSLETPANGSVPLMFITKGEAALV